MASLIYNSFWDDVLRGLIDVDSVTVRVMLTTSAYTEDKDTHTKRSNVTNEVTGTGYTAGGVVSTVTVTKDNATDRVTISLGAVNWPSATLTARKAVYYVARGGAATADELIAVSDFDSDVTATGATFSLNATSIPLQN
jgi:hypothetical protein